MLGLPAIVVLRDLGPLPGDKLAHTVWARGMRVVNDVAGTPIKPEEVEIGQLINAEPGVFYEETRTASRSTRASGSSRPRPRPRSSSCG